MQKQIKLCNWKKRELGRSEGVAEYQINPSLQEIWVKKRIDYKKHKQIGQIIFKTTHFYSE